MDSKNPRRALPLILFKATRVDSASVMLVRSAGIDALQSDNVDRQRPAAPVARLFMFKNHGKKI